MTVRRLSLALALALAAPLTPAARADVKLNPLFTDHALKWAPGTVKCVSVDALPQQLGYVRSGHVQLLLAQDVYGYGQRAVEHLVNKLHFKKVPPSVIDDTPLTAVTKENVETFSKNWDKWLPK